MIHEKNTSIGDSFLYFFAEEGHELESHPYYKIGIVTHAKTDEGIKRWKKYIDSPAPPSITRRILKLNNGNPRQLVPLAYFRFTDSSESTGLAKSRKVETKWKRAWRTRVEQMPSSTEWYRSSQEELRAIVHEIIDSEAGVYTTYWVPTRDENC